ncbi:major type 1 subunit fimbrin (pilin) [Acinetobacter calcoaceticus]|uniref:Major type 1 subunit fimbrin (Pilin) n=1 Tax=Acinetobacter calcoaceticus TaxID=471 RepID=A0A4R1Y3P6_ACICA|nr:major type 1 subunit fimbrin (pilin) [Acinetobacter calcoaceticus]
MKKIALIASLAVAGIANVYASDGKITINGEITDQTCTLIGPGGKDFTVTLPTVGRGALATAGSTTGLTPFTLTASNCPATKISTYFEPHPLTVNLATGRLKNSTAAGSATLVEVELLGDNGLPIALKGVDSTGAQTNSQIVTMAAGESKDLQYAAQYYATGAATAGLVNTSIEYTVIYP